MDRGDDTQRDPRDPGSPEAGAPVWSRQWALSWLKATPVVRALWRAERESPPDGGSQRRVASPPAHQSQDPPSPSTPQPATTAGEAASHETETPLDIRPRLPRRIDLELPCPLPVEAEPWSPIATERTPQNRAERNEVLLPAENRRPASPRGPTPKLPRFNGTSSLEAFLAQFELFAAEYDWTDRRKATYLSQALEGLASEVLLDLSCEERVDCTALTTALKRRFGDCDSNLGLQEQLQHRRRAPGEKLGALAADIARLARRAYSDEPDSFSRRIALDTFLRSLQPPLLRHQVRLAGPRTLEEAVNRAIAIEAVLQDEEPLHRNPTTRPVCSMAEGIPGCEYGLDPPPRVRAVATGRGRVRERVCWRCGQPGHLIADCRRLEHREMPPPGPAGNGAGSA